MSDGARDSGLELSRDRGTLFVVATPIGNLEDITLRALRVLREVAIVAAEDTRRSGNLLRHYDIHTPLVSLHEHNERARGTELLARLAAGDSVALVSDAGTPAISDPGALFVAAARAAGVRVEPVPGASAVSAILSASGLSFDRYAFAGFPPIRLKDRNLWFSWVEALPDIPVVCFEAPHRIARTLTDASRLLVNRPITIARELTKLHEEWTFLQPGSEKEVSIAEKGEFVLVFAPATTPTDTPAEASDEEIAGVFWQITEISAHSSRRQAVKAAAARLRLTARTVYDALERVKKTPQT